MTVDRRQARQNAYTWTVWRCPLVMVCAPAAATIAAIHILYARWHPELLYIYPLSFQGEVRSKLLGLAASVAVSLIGFTAIAFAMRFCRQPRVPVTFPAIGGWPPFALACATGLVVLIAYSILDTFENSADEFVYVFQSRLYLQGRYFADPPPIEHAFSTSYLVEKAGRWTGQYPPGWPAILAAARWFGIPGWTVNPILSTVSLPVFYALSRKVGGHRVGLVAVTIFATSLFYLFNSASYFSHASFVLAAMLFALSLVNYLADGRRVWLIAAGGAIAAACTIRYYPAVLVSLPVVIYFLMHPRLLKDAPWPVLGGAPIILLLLHYHQMAFGDAFTTGYAWKGYGSTGLTLDLAAAGRFTPIALWELMNWTSPPLALLYLLAFLSKLRAGRSHVIDWIFPCVVLGLVFFPDPGGNRYGPRYYYDAFPFMIFTIASGMSILFQKIRTDTCRQLVAYLILFHYSYTVVSLPFVANYFRHAVHERQDVFRLVAKNNVNNAIVILDSGTGRRLPMPASDLARNNPGLSQSVLFATGTTPAELHKVFPDRQVWRYTRKPNEEHGRLRPINSPQ